MSVIVKGIKFPHGCGDCPCLGGEDYNYYCQVTNNGIPLDGHRPDWCPLVEIKPHGDLIDRDALYQSIKESMNECHKWANEIPKDNEMYCRVSQALGTFLECALRTKNAPTIIEEER